MMPTTAIIAITIQGPPYPPIQLPPHQSPFIMFPLCAKEEVELNSGTELAAHVIKCFMIFPSKSEFVGPLTVWTFQPK